ncbi:Hypothetical protein PACV_462 [Pacmanvirus A23]|uniref:Hypothetical protein n=1 Tax=Pacmanvirus A23 TaxID=1932881 RepID=UPI000A094127|nr:Hypothetical protein B9W72_gp461 [Pacmanvirus A23]SIP86174.1 Hypothetical protein PACV_462 [Pacmanvirus A23]
MQHVINVFYYCEKTDYESKYFIATINDFIGMIECVSCDMNDLRRQIHNIVIEQLQNLGINPANIIIKEQLLPDLVY